MGNKTIKELEALDEDFQLTGNIVSARIKALKDVLGLIDEYIKSKEDCCLKCKEELKKRITG